MDNKIELHAILEYKHYNFQHIFFNLIISVIQGAKITKFGTHVAEDHSEGTMSQIFYLGLCFYFIQSRKLSCKKW